MSPSLTWLIGRQEWPIVKQRLHDVLDESTLDSEDANDVTEDRKASMLLCFAISAHAPPEILNLLLECHPLQENVTPLRVATAMKAPKKTVMILEEALSPLRSSSPPSVLQAQRIMMLGSCLDL